MVKNNLGVRKRQCEVNDVRKLWLKNPHIE